MHKTLLKLVIISLAVTGGVLVFGGGSASAASYENNNCTGAPYDTWGNHDVSGEGAGVMASLRVKAYSTDAKDGKNLINTTYRLSSSGNPPAQIFNYQNWQDAQKGKTPAGAVRTQSAVFSTGEWLTGGANGAYRCNGWSVLAPGRVVTDKNTGQKVRLVGNGWILDCKDSTGANVQYTFSDLGKPDGESGYWTLKRWDKYSNRMVPDGEGIRFGANGVSVVFNVDNGENNTIHLIWHPDPSWKLRGHTGINKTTVKAGGTVKFDQTVSNDQGSPADYKWRISTRQLGSSSWTAGAWQSESNVNAGGKKPNQRVYSVDIPDNASAGQTICQRIEYTNKYGGAASDPTRSTSSPANSTWPADDNNVKCATVVAEPTATGMCRYLYVQTPASYTGPSGNVRKTRALVSVQNVEVNSYRDKKTANSANPDGIEYSANYNNIPAGSTGPSQTVVIGSGSVGTPTSFLWKYTPTKMKVHIKVTYQYDSKGTGADSSWLNIGSSQDINQDYSCVSATCKVTVDGTGPVRKDGSGNIVRDEYGNELHYVLAGEEAGAKITAEVKNTGDPAQQTQLFNTTFKFGSGTSDGTGKLGPGDTGYATLDDVNVPSSVASNWTGTLTMSDSKISNLTFSPPCTFNVPLYKTFTVQPLAYTRLLPTDEAPTNFDYWGGAFTTNTTRDVTMNWGACTYRESSEPRESNPCRNPMLRPALGRSTFNSTIDPPFKGNETNVVQPVEAGNQFCTVFDVEYTSGYIGSDGTIVDGVKDPAITPFDNCRPVKNKPYFKAYGKGIRAGGDFTGVCKTGGLLAGWNNTSSTNKGASSELSALALIKITGVASAQAKAGNSPTKLTFANNDPATIPSDPDSPYLGGNYATDADSERFCFDDVQPPAEVTTPSGEPAAGTPGSQKYTNNGSPRVLSGATALATNQSVFVDGDVYIDSDIKYDNWSDPSNIPSFILRATGNIYINADVTQLDGMYVAGNKIYTCADSSTHKQKRSGNGVESGNNLYYECNQQLVVNGVFIAKQINMMRTFGSLRNSVAGENESSTSRACANGSNKKVCAAEYFNFSPELYLAKPKIQSANGGTGKYDSIVSLPPVL